MELPVIDMQGCSIVAALIVTAVCVTCVFVPCVYLHVSVFLPLSQLFSEPRHPVLQLGPHLRGFLLLPCLLCQLCL